MTYHESSARTPSVTSVTGASRRIGRALPEAVCAEVRAERRGNRDRSVRLLMMLEDRGDDAREGEAGAVERVHQARLPSLRGPVLDPRTSRLKVGEVAARRDLEPRAHARGEDF